jgi:hypothetical protein
MIRAIACLGQSTGLCCGNFMHRTASAGTLGARAALIIRSRRVALSAKAKGVMSVSGKSAKHMAHSTGIDGFGLRWESEAVILAQATAAHTD